MKSFAGATDTQLISVFRKGDLSALETLINRHKDSVFSTITFMVKDNHVADDIFQEVFLRVIDKLRSNNYNEEGRFSSWVIRCAHNACIDYFRKIQYTISVGSNDKDIFEEIGDTGDAADSYMVQSETHEKIRQMLDYLPDEQREVIVLRHFGDMSFKEIADITGTSINTALGRMRYALLNLRRLMAENEIAL